MTTNGSFRIKLLTAEDPPESFPDPKSMRATLGYPDGLLAIGGDLSLERLLYAYRHGIFPWYNEDQPIMWWSPDPRAVIFPENFHMSRSLARQLRKEDWEYSLNENFATVIHACAENRDEHGTWITPDMLHAYQTLHEAGYAHSIETWRNGELAGGIYGLRLGNVFFGESMFSTLTDGSKVAISALVQLCKNERISMLDCQLESSHLATLGMVGISRDKFLSLLPDATANAQPLPNWQLVRQSAAPLSSLRN